MTLPSDSELDLNQLLEDSAYSPLEEGLLADARMPQQMDPARLAAVEAGLLAAMAAPAAEASAAASTAARWWVAGGVAVVGIAAALLVREPEVPAPLRASAPALAVPASPEPAPETPQIEELKAAPAPVVEPEPELEATPKKQPATKAAPKAPPPSADTAVEEARLLAAAQRAYKASDYAAAKRKLDEHARKYPKGKLAESRESTRAALRCKQDPTGKAGHRAAFEKRYPSSAFMRRVAKACE